MIPESKYALQAAMFRMLLKELVVDSTVFIRPRSNNIGSICFYCEAVSTYAWVNGELKLINELEHAPDCPVALAQMAL